MSADRRPEPLAYDALAEQDLERQIDALRRAIQAESAEPRPDLGRIRAMRAAVKVARLKLDAVRGEPPPHTD